MYFTVGYAPVCASVDQPAGIIIEEMNLKEVLFHDIRGLRQAGYFSDYRFEGRGEMAGRAEALVRLWFAWKVR
jgi:hypothetical protein